MKKSSRFSSMVLPCLAALAIASFTACCDKPMAPPPPAPMMDSKQMTK